MNTLRQWAAPPAPLARVAVLRTAIYLFVLFDIARIPNGPFSYGDAPGQIYQPLGIRTLFRLPAPSHGYVRVLAVVIVVSALVAATGAVAARAPESSGGSRKLV